jgi:hypothetical protein
MTGAVRVRPGMQWHNMVLCGKNPTGLCLGQSQQASCPSIIPPDSETNGMDNCPQSDEGGQFIGLLRRREDGELLTSNGWLSKATQ